MKRTLLICIPIIILAILFNPFMEYLNRQKSINPDKVTSTFDPNQKAAAFHGEQVAVPTPAPEQNNQAVSDVLGSKKKTKQIRIDLSNQKLYLYEGDKKIKSFLVSTGKWGRTPTGEFTIWTKLRYTRMTGGSKELNTFYDLPNVPYTMFFYNKDVTKARGYGIHGTYWHSNFGHPMSHGCINMKTDEAGEVFEWASAEKDGVGGTKIIIYGTAPAS